MSRDTNSALAHRVIEEIWNQRRLDLFNELFAPTFFDHNPSANSVADLASLKQSARLLLHGFPDLQVTINDLLVDDDRVLLCMTMHGTHTGAFLNIAPTGRRVAVTTYSILRIANDQVVERWSLMDMFELYQQLGVVRLETASSI